MRSNAAHCGGVMLAMLLAASADAGAHYDAKTNYVLHCSGCHGLNGVSALPESVPPLANSIGYFLRVADGRRYLVQVPGSAYSAVDDADLAEILNYVLQHFSPAQLPAKFRRYSAEEVARVRRSPEDILALRARLVAELRKDPGACIWVADDPAWESKCGGAYESPH